MKLFKKVHQNIFKYSIEGLIVAFGVFLGIFASEWKAQNKTDKKVEKTLVFLVGEMQLNSEKFNASIQYHEALKVSFDGVLKTVPEAAYRMPYINNKYFIYNNISGWNGVRTVRPENMVFNGAGLTGVMHELDIELVQKISRVYNQQDTYIEFSNMMLESIVKGMNTDSKVGDIISMIQLLTSDILNLEKGTKKLIDQTIQELRSEYNIVEN